MKFEQYNLHPSIKRNLAKLGFVRATDIQYKCIPAVLREEDVLAIAQTGTGKTAAFAIPIIHKLLTSNRKVGEKQVKVLVMAPTHELARQISDVFLSIGRDTRLNVLFLHGGVDQTPQVNALAKGVDILVATPGRLFDLRSQGHLDLSAVIALVLDEADHMLDLGFIKDIRDLMKYLPKRRQTLFFSATIDEKIKDLAYSLVINPVRIQISPKDPVSRNIDHYVSFIEMDDKRYFLERLSKDYPDAKIIVFVRTKVRAERVKLALERAGIISLTLHSGKSSIERNDTMRKLKKGEERILIATDVSARGIDIADVQLVVNYDLPEKPENYVHRVGRTGRGEKKGTAITFCGKEELPNLELIENTLGKKITRMEIDPQTYESTIKLDEERRSDWKALIKDTEWDRGKNKRKK